MNQQAGDWVNKGNAHKVESEKKEKNSSLFAVGGGVLTTLST